MPLEYRDFNPVFTHSQAVHRGVGNGLMGGEQEVMRSLSRISGLCPEIMEVLISEGTQGFRPVLEALLNETMKVDREMHLKAAPYERTEQRRGQANGFKPKTLTARLGSLQLEIPQVRDSSFYPQSLERGCRSEVALKVALAEM